LGKDLEWADCCVLFALLGEDGSQGSLKLRHRLGIFFACEGRGRLGWARSQIESMEALPLLEVGLAFHAPLQLVGAFDNRWHRFSHPSAPLGDG
jgi:hypothetical protein